MKVFDTYYWAQSYANRCKDALLEPSDEEILGYSTSESEEEDIKEDEATNEAGAKSKDDSESEALGEGDENAGGWGSSKRDYYNADNIETEADALEEEAEAKRLQQKKLQKMSEADFGFDENEWLDADNADNDGDVVTEVLKDIEITADMGSEERLNLLRTRYPEFESLASEFLKLQPLFESLQLEANEVAKSEKSTKAGTRLALIKLRALAAYLGALTMYFAIFTSPAKAGSGKLSALDPMELRDHNVMESLLHCRELWSKVTNLKPSLDVEPEEVLVTAEIDILDNNEDLAPPTQEQEPVSKKSRKERARELAAAEAKRARAERIRATEEELQDLSSLLPKVKKPSKPSSVKPTMTAAESDSDFGEEESLSSRALAEKAAKKKSLRFYTSQIAQKANRRADAGRDAGGDADLPYRERLRDRQARLNAEAEKRGKKLDKYGRGAALGGDESGDDGADTEVANAVRGEEDDYYDMVTQASRKKKKTKQSGTQRLLPRKQSARPSELKKAK